MRLALLAAIVAHIAVICIVGGLRTPPTVVASHATYPINISVPIMVEAPEPPSPPPPSPPAGPVRASCPPIATDAPPADSIDPPKDVNHVFASRTNASWIAAWNEQHVFVSTDGGETFEHVLDGPGQVEEVTFDCFGHVVALRADVWDRGEETRNDAWVGIRDGMRETWRLVPGLSHDPGNPGTLIGGGPDILVFGVSDAGHGARLAVTSDVGATWWFRDVADYAELGRTIGYQASDGSIQLVLVVPDCDSEPAYWVRLRDGKLDAQYLGYVGHAVLDGDRLYAERDGEVRYRRFGDEDWQPTKSKRARKLVSGSLDAAGRVWSIRETIDGEAAWAAVTY